MQNKMNLRKELQEPGYDVLLMTSFSTDLVFFERMILRHVLEQQCRYIGLFVDGPSLDEELAKPCSLYELGKSYIVQPIYGKGAFHPKVCLLLGENKAKAIVSSANLTAAGFITNGEVGKVITYDGSNEAELPIIQAVYRFFQFYARFQTTSSLQAIFEKTRDYAYLTKTVPSHPTRAFLHNGTESLDEQIKSRLIDEVQHIDIMVPYFDRTLSVVQQWQDRYPSSCFAFFLQPHTSNFPIQATQPKNGTYRAFQFSSPAYEKKRYHGKVFRFQGKEADLMVYGSANCSRPAWLESYEAGGNAEAVLLEQGEKGQFAPFFTEEIVSQVTPLSSLAVQEEIGEQTIQQGSPVRFVEAVKNEKGLLLTLQCEQAIHHAFIEGNAGQITHQQGCWQVRWTEDIPSLSPVFSFDVQVGKDRFTQVGWIQDEQALSDTQTQISNSIYTRMKDDPYLTDYQNLIYLLQDFLERLILTEEDAEKKLSSRRTSVALHEAAEMNEEIAAASEMVEAYYVEDEEPAGVYGAIGTRDVLGELIRQLLAPFREETADNESPYAHSTSRSEERQTQNALLRKPLQGRIRHLMNRFNKGLRSPVYLEKVTEEVLLTNAALYTQFLWKVYELETESPLITQDEIIEEVYRVLDGVCSFGKKNVLQHEYIEASLLPQFIAILVAEDVWLDQEENFYLSSIRRKKIGLRLKEIHDYVAPIRVNYPAYLDIVGKYVARLGVRLQVEEMQKRIERRFPFILFSQFLATLSQFPLEVRQYPTLEKPLIVFHIDRFKSSMEFNLLQLRLLAKMVSVEEWKDCPQLKMVFRNQEQTHPLKKYSLSYYRRKKKLKKTYEYRSAAPVNESEKEPVVDLYIVEAAEQGNVQYIVDGFK